MITRKIKFFIVGFGRRETAAKRISLSLVGAEGVSRSELSICDGRNG
jgi:hypothetical protein